MREEKFQRRFRAFKKFHRENPQVFQVFIRFALQARKSRRRYGARSIGERVRWYTTIETITNDDYKINNNHWPYYSRLLMLSDPRFTGFFERRDRHFDVGDAELVAQCGKDLLRRTK